MALGEISRREVEAKLAVVGDYVKMDFLQQCLKKNLDFDTRKFVLTTLAGIYEDRKILAEAGKLMRASAEINTTYDAKMQDFMKSSELYVKAGVFDESDISFAKALACGSEMQKNILKQKRKELYVKQAEEWLQRDKRKHALDAYEKLLTMELNAGEKQKAHERLLELYEKLGKVREYSALKKTM